jgi:DNA topoisomerase-1
MSRLERAFLPATHDEVREARGILIPPAYTKILLAKDPNEPLQATALTPKGKTAYYYHPEHLKRRAVLKWQRVRVLVKRIDELATLIHERAQEGDTRALTLLLILLTGMRNGNPGQGEKPAYGASSLLLEHVVLRRESPRIVLHFPGKKGVLQHFELDEQVLFEHIRQRQIACDFDPKAKLFPHDARATLRCLRRLAGRIKVHDLRTWHATMLAVEFIKLFRAEGIPEEKLESAVAKQVAARLGNTPAVVRKAYFDPMLFQKEEPA